MASALLTLEQAARVAGHARWLEDRLFSVVGEWVAVEEDPAAKALFAAHSLRHAWHASVWHDRFPRVAHLDVDALTVPAGPRVAAAVDDLVAGTRAGSGAGVDRLSLQAQLLSPLVAAYRERVAVAHPLADGPTRRWLGFVLADEVAALGQVRALLSGRGAASRLQVHDLSAEALLGLTSSDGA